MNTINLEVQGMSCGSCVNHVTQALKPVEGVHDVAVDLPSGRVRVSGALEAGAQGLIAALAAAGYPATLSSATAMPAQANAPSAQPKTSRGCCCG